MIAQVSHSESGRTARRVSIDVEEKVRALLAALAGHLPRHPGSKAKLERSLNALAGMGFEAGRAFEREQWDADLADIPHEARDAHARGLWQGLEAVNRARTLDEARDIIMAITIQTSPMHLRQSSGPSGPSGAPRGAAGGRPSGPDGPDRFEASALQPAAPSGESVSLGEPGSPKPVRKRTDWLRLLLEALGDE